MTRFMPSPIQNVDAFDVIGERRGDGVDLVVTCSGPLDSSSNTLNLLEAKVNAYLATVAHPRFSQTYQAVATWTCEDFRIMRAFHIK